MLQTFRSICLLVAFVALACAQTNTLTQTSLSAAIARGDTVIPVSSATNIVAQSIASGAVGTQLYVQDPGSKGEVMTVLGVSGTNLTVGRGAGGTAAVAHISGAMVLAGQPNWFYGYDPQGACTTASTFVTPWVNINTGNQWLCSTVTLSWVPGWQNLQGAPGPTTLQHSTTAALVPSGPLFHMDGTSAITSITIPVGFNNGQFCIIPDAAFTATKTGNINAASTAVAGKPLCYVYDAAAALFNPTY